MKIAIACDGNNVSGHFGHCEGFTVYKVSEGKVEEASFLENPGHKPGFLPKYLGEKGINTIISGGMGEMAQTLFGQNNIEVVVGASGDIDDVIAAYLSGSLLSTGGVCEGHEHSDSCGGH
jgi:predicted Fe-Mo cluster-binding NifX family protein